MVTQSQVISETWVDLNSALNLVIGDTYLVQVTGVHGALLREEAAPPAALNKDGHIVKSGDTWTITIDPTNIMYARSLSDAHGTTLTISGAG